MKKMILVSLVFLVSNMASAAQSAEASILSKAAAIEKVSAECYKDIKLTFQGADLTILQFLYTMALNSEETIISEFSAMKTAAGASCEQYKASLNVYVKTQEAQFLALSENLKKCLASSPEETKALTTMADQNKDISVLLAEFKTLDYRKEITCVQVRNRIMDELNK